jgi:DTW domain-containing protein YfiP
MASSSTCTHTAANRLLTCCTGNSDDRDGSGRGSDGSNDRSSTHDDADIRRTTTASRRRTNCTRCHRPQRVCICAALPSSSPHVTEAAQAARPLRRLLSLGQCHCLILQHPHESRRKNRSLPFVELCLDQKSYTRVTCRRFFHHWNDDIVDAINNSNTVVACTSNKNAQEDEDIAKAMSLLTTKDDSPTRNPVWLVYPHPDAVSLDEALAELRQAAVVPHDESSSRTGGGSPGAVKVGVVVVTLVFFDATWQFAKEMDRANQEHYARHGIKRVQLGATDFHELFVHENTNSSSSSSSSSSGNGNNSRSRSKAKRFDIRTPPSERHLSTAECLAWTVSKIEQQPNEIYETLMKPLDLAVEQWHSFRLEKDQRTINAAAAAAQQADNNASAGP